MAASLAQLPTTVANRLRVRLGADGTCSLHPQPLAPSSPLSRTRPTGPEPRSSLSQRLTARHQELLRQWGEELVQAPGWRGDLPVAVLEPCWLRLRRVAVEDLASQLPPDGSEAAPELVRFRQLRQSGLDEWSAQQQCWQEFGSAAFQQAQRRFWQRQDQGNHDWTLARYLELIEIYRRRLSPGGVRRLPLLVLARQGSEEPHALFWLAPIGGR